MFPQRKKKSNQQFIINLLNKYERHYGYQDSRKENLLQSEKSIEQQPGENFEMKRSIDKANKVSSELYGTNSKEKISKKHFCLRQRDKKFKNRAKWFSKNEEVLNTNKVF